MVLGVPKSMLVRLGWVTLTFGAVQFLRLLNNVILTRLLEPSVFGLMSLVVAIRVGMELVSDLGVTQNIVSNPRGARAEVLRYGVDVARHAEPRACGVVFCPCHSVCELLRPSGIGDHPSGSEPLLRLFRLRIDDRRSAPQAAPGPSRWVCSKLRSQGSRSSRKLEQLSCSAMCGRS